ncbi:MAG TPA: UDP-3-O-acyl-N-acetylglucosamine deacetylase [Myxococcaceae bacterium]|nr:UDP-3-O-acyl-N-acetylglucosamine deacetylase [Myxococcaceae bacterium]
MHHSSFNQRTISAPVSCQGVGLHSGAKVDVTLLPAREEHGVVFARVDLAGKPVIPARSQYVVDTMLATTLGKDGVRLGTVEHLLSAISGLGVDNLRVEVNGPEVPIMDGSAAPFASLIRSAGVRVQEAPKSFVVIKKPVTVVDGDKEATLSPARSFKVSCTIDFKHPLITDQSFELDFSDHSFSKEISRARTFGFLKEVEKLKQIGLARGGSLENAIVVDEYNILNQEPLRFPNEFVRHKILDCIGDMALFGRPVIGHLRVHKTGHALNHKLVEKVLADPTSFEVVEAHKGHVERLELRLPHLGGALEPLVA